MARIVSNRLLSGSLLALALYWAIGFVAPTPYLSSTSSLMLFLCGLMVFVRYAPTAFEVVVKGRRGDTPGSHLAVYGMTFISAGSCYIGAFGLLWVGMGQPNDWLGTAYSGFGRAVMAAGFWMAFVSPDASTRDVKVPSLIWLAVLGSIALAAAFFLGIMFGDSSGKAATRLSVARLTVTAERPACPSNRPVWGASRSNIYHASDSPYREQVVPRRCFATETDAARAGYRPPAA